MKKIYALFAGILFVNAIFSQLTVTSFANNSNICLGNSTSITASATPITYSISSIPTNLISDYGINILADFAGITGSTPASLTVGSLNDGRWDNISIPFTFRFYGNPYTSVNVSSNGWVGLGSTNSTTTGIGFVLPNSIAPNNTVHGVTANLTLATSGVLEYYTDGVAPNRVFVVSYQNVPFAGASGTTTFQVQLFETSNIVEIHTSSCSNTTLPKAQGIENAAGDVATVSPGRNNTTTWSGFTNSYRFTPDAINFTWSPAAGLNTTSGSVVTASPASSTTYTINAVNTSNGATGSANVTINIDPASYTLAATPGGAQICQNISVSGGGTNYRDGNCNLIATVTPSGATPVTNVINTCIKVDVNATKRGTLDLYLARKYDIEPQVNAANATATIKLYYLQSEFDNYNARALDSGHKPLPTSSSDVTGIGNVLLRQFHGTGTNPTNYTGAPVDFTAATPGFSTIWNATRNWWEVTVPINGFSGFYLSSSKLGTVNIKLNYFTGVQVSKNNVLKWRVNCTSDNAKFELQRSSDGITYQTIKSITATKLECDAPFEYIDDNATAGKNYYRLKLIDVDGKTTFSNTVVLTTKTSGYAIESVYPNPVINATATLKVNAYQKELILISITDIAGRIIKNINFNLQIGVNQIPISMEKVAKGTYHLTISSANAKSQSIKVFKN